jgi:PAS domain S-box-containing protein
MMKDKPVILVVDDQPQNVDLLEAYLVPQGYEIVKASSGKEALGKLSGNHIDLMLLDVIMPGMDGFEVTRRVRKDNTHRLLPIILVTALRDVDDRVKGIDAGCDDFISKPFDKMELSARVRSLLKVKEYNELMSHYREELESEVIRRTEELKQAFLFQQQLIDALPVPVFYKDAEGRYLGCNRSFEKFFGQKRERVTGKSAYELCPKKFADQYHKKDLALLQNPGIQLYESTVKDADGVVHEVIFHRATFPNTDGSVGGLIGAILDITERKKAEEVLRESEKKYRLLADNVDDIIFVLDMDLYYIYVSPSVKTMREYEPEEMLNQSFLDSLTPSSQDLAMKTVAEVMALEKSTDGKMNISRTLQLEMIRKNGTVVWTEMKFSLLRDEDQRPVGILGVARDITERKQAEEELRQTLDSLGKAFRTTIQVMVSAVETRDPYTAGHQVRTADLAGAIAVEMRLLPDRIIGIRMAGSIHDIGKLSIPAEILSKPSKLTTIEFSLIKEHSRHGYEMLKDVESPWPLAEIVYQHHERMDGSGYPRNLKGDEILMEARVMAVADVVEAMASHRPYRSALGIDAALAEIENNRGELYDAEVVDTCLKLFREKNFQLTGA